VDRVNVLKLAIMLTISSLVLGMVICLLIKGMGWI